jgi:lysophospholipase L1-like esterase
LLYANLAARGAPRDIVERQLARAIAMRPDLATVFSGTNDVLRARFDVRAFSEDVLRLQGDARRAPRLCHVHAARPHTAAAARSRNRAAHPRHERRRARCVRRDRHDAASTSRRCRLASDARLWNEDRIHANPNGHERIAQALAEAPRRRAAMAHGARRFPARPVRER